MLFSVDNIMVRSVKQLYELVTEEEIIYCFHGPFEIDAFIKALDPDRQDDNPSARFTISRRSGKLVYADFGRNESLDAFDFVSTYYLSDYSYAEALNEIYTKVREARSNGNLAKMKVIEKRIKTVAIDVDVKKMTRGGYRDYWKGRKIKPETILRFDVLQMTSAWVNNKWIYDYSKEDPGYVYVVDDIQRGSFSKFQWYRPLAKDLRDKWRVQGLDGDAFGMKQLMKGQYGIITKAPKDVMGLVQEYGINSISPFGEGNLIAADLVLEFKKYCRKGVFSLMDPDPAGRLSSEKYLEEYDITPIFIPKSYKEAGLKDPDEMICNNKKVLTDLLKPFIL